MSLCHPAGKEETASEGEGSQQGNAPEEGHTGGQWRENTAPDPYADLSREQLASELQERDGALSASAAEVISHSKDLHRCPCIISPSPNSPFSS